MRPTISCQQFDTAKKVLKESSNQVNANVIRKVAARIGVSYSTARRILVGEIARPKNPNESKSKPRVKQRPTSIAAASSATTAAANA